MHELAVSLFFDSSLQTAWCSHWCSFVCNRFIASAPSTNGSIKHRMGSLTKKSSSPFKNQLKHLFPCFFLIQRNGFVVQLAMKLLKEYSYRFPCSVSVIMDISASAGDQCLMESGDLALFL